MMSITTEIRIEQEELDAIKKSVLTSSRSLLVDSLDPANHLTYLRSKFVLTERDAEEIAAPASRSARVEVFLDKLSLKGAEAYDEFQNSLIRDKTQLFILTSMTKKLELLRHRVRDFKIQQMRQQQELLHRQQEQYHRQKPPPPTPQQGTYHQHQHQRQQSFERLPYSPPPTFTSNGGRAQQHQRPSQFSQFTVQHHQQPRQQVLTFQPTPAQQAQRDAYCQKRLAEINSSQNRSRQNNHTQQTPPPQSSHPYQSMGFSPPPCYSSSPPPTHHFPNGHQVHTPPPQNSPPNFQSRGDPTDEFPRPPHSHHTTNENSMAGFASDVVTHTEDVLGAQPCGQPS